MPRSPNLRTERCDPLRTENKVKVVACRRSANPFLPLLHRSKIRYRFGFKRLLCQPSIRERCSNYTVLTFLRLSAKERASPVRHDLKRRSFAIMMLPPRASDHRRMSVFILTNVVGKGENRSPASPSMLSAPQSSAFNSHLGKDTSGIQRRTSRSPPVYRGRPRRLEWSCDI